MNIDKFLRENGRYRLVAYKELGYSFEGSDLFDFLEKFKQEICKEQRDSCLENAKTITTEYVNPYSESDGDKNTRIIGNSILLAPEPKLERRKE